MAVSIEIARIRNLVDELARGVAADKRARHPMSETDKRTLRSEIEVCMQKLDELRNQLSS